MRLWVASDITLGHVLGFQSYMNYNGTHLNAKQFSFIIFCLFVKTILYIFFIPETLQVSIIY